MLIYNELSKKILEAYFNVFKHLTTGLLESVYEKALCIEFDEIPELTPANTAQLINYLKITGMSVGYLLNFGESRDYKRIINK